MEYIKLNNGMKIPLVGIGTNTFGKVGNDYFEELNYDTKELNLAIDLGYKLLDTAISYRNEAVIGKAIAESNIPRKDFIITTKLPGKEGYRSKSEIDAAIKQSLTNLQTDYIDIFLIHSPWDNNEEMIEVYNHLETYVSKGIIKTLGVSNFNEEQLALIVNNSTIKPTLNQIASYPGNWNHDLVAYGNKLGIVSQAWSPLNRVDDITKSTLSEIGSKYNKSWAQVILNYQVRRGVIVIPKSHRFEGQSENINIFDFNLTEEEIKTIENL